MQDAVLLIQEETGNKRKVMWDIYTFSPAEMLVLPSASLEDGVPMPADSNTVHKMVQPSQHIGKKTSR